MSWPSNIEQILFNLSSGDQSYANWRANLAALVPLALELKTFSDKIQIATNVLYVDNKRIDSYTEVGTYNLPFKSIQAALNSITGSSANNRFCIKIATGNGYTENLTINKDYITLEGYGDTILSGNLTFATTAVHVKFRDLKLTGNATGAYTNAFVIDICDCNTATGKNWTFSCTVSGAYIQVSGQSTLWYANFILSNITGVIANQGGYFEGTHTFNTCNGEFIGFENYGGTININAGSEIHVGASMCIDTVINLASGATLHIDVASAGGATLHNNGGTLDRVSDKPILQASVKAEIYVADNSNAISIPSGSTYTKITSFTTNGYAENCTADAVNDQIVITKAGYYRITANFSTKLGTTDVLADTAVFINDVEQPNIHARRRFSTAGYTFVVSFDGFTTAALAVNDIVTIRVKHNSASAVSATLEYGSLKVIRVGM